MKEKAHGSETGITGRTLNETIHTIYKRCDESKVHKLTTLLVTALRDGDYRSRSALAGFFGLPLVSQADLDASKLDSVLLRDAILFINNENANRVQTWVSSYKKSPAHSRSLHENILRNFVSSRTEVEKLKLHVSQARSLAGDAELKFKALEGIIKSMQKP
jgi:hypothetical protein